MKSTPEAAQISLYITPEPGSPRLRTRLVPPIAWCLICRYEPQLPPSRDEWIKPLLRAYISFTRLTLILINWAHYTPGPSFLDSLSRYRVSSQMSQPILFPACSEAFLPVSTLQEHLTGAWAAGTNSTGSQRGGAQVAMVRMCAVKSKAMGQLSFSVIWCSL